MSPSPAPSPGYTATSPPIKSSAHRAPTKCELDVWNIKAGEFERQTRATNPDLSALDIQKRLERERPFFMAEARVECNE